MKKKKIKALVLEIFGALNEMYDLRGPMGPPGSPGPQGRPGERGPRGVDADQGIVTGSDGIVERMRAPYSRVQGPAHTQISRSGNAQYKDEFKEDLDD